MFHKSRNLLAFQSLEIADAHWK